MHRLLLLALVPAAALAEAPPPSVTSPKSEGVVGVKEPVTGKFFEGWPVIVVRTPTGEVWAQQPAVRKINAFTGEAYFGDKDNTGRGTRYELFALIAPDRKAAADVKPGLLKELPKWAASKPVVVYRDERVAFGGHTWAFKKGADLGPGPNS